MLLNSTGNLGVCVNSTLVILVICDALVLTPLTGQIQLPVFITQFLNTKVVSCM